MHYNYVRLKEILNTNKEFGFFALIQLDWAATHFFTSHPHDLTWNGNAYIADSTILEIENPRYSEVVDREAYTISLSAMNTNLMNEVKSGIVHRPVTVKLGFTLDGEPQLGNNDLFNIYTGRVANSKFVTENEQQILNIECSAPLSNLDETSGILTTKSFMQSQIDATDTTFDYLHEDSKTSTKGWGRIGKD